MNKFEFQKAEFPVIPDMTGEPDFTLRAMRDAVFGKSCSQNNWDGCKEAWKKDEPWLTEQYNKLKARNTIPAQPF